MRGILILLILCCPLFGYGHPFRDLEVEFHRVGELLYGVQYHREKAIEEIKKAKNLTSLMPNLENKNYIDSLLTATLGAILIKQDVRGIVFLQALSFIAPFTTEKVSNYKELQETLIKIDYHIDMYKFYDYMYRHTPAAELRADGCVYSAGAQHFLCGMKEVFLASRVAFMAFEDGEKNEPIIKSIDNFIIVVSKKIKDAKCKFSHEFGASIIKEFNFFNERFNKIFTDRDSEIRSSIFYYIELAGFHFRRSIEV